jgi:mRNA interferase MazF
MVDKNYIPEIGDIVWIDLDPTLGHEQKGRRPVMVVSSLGFNSKSKLVYICPITSTERDYLFRIPLIDQNTSGFVMVDHLRSVSWKVRNLKFIERSSKETLQTVINFIQAAINPTSL